MNHQTIVDQLTKLGVKNVRIQNQLNYLKNAAEQQFLPRGIGDQMKFTCSIHDLVLQSMCQSLTYFAGSRILDLIV